MDEKFLHYYETLYEKRLAEPESATDVERILDCIRVRNGVLDQNDEDQLKPLSNLFQQKMRLFVSDSREIKAEYTKAISNQLYDDPFRFFYEILQNADDASYVKAREEEQKPCIVFRIQQEGITVDLNEDGFSLADVLAICSTGKSSKKANAETTGEKGFGFKAVFGIASVVHIQSGLWSFSFKHERHEDGIGMISPIWKTPTLLPEGVRTRLVLNYGNIERESIAALHKQLASQPVTILNFLRNIKSMKMSFEDVPEVHKEVAFEVLDPLRKGYAQLSSTIDGCRRVHCYRGVSKLIENMPPRDGREVNRSSQVILRFPVRDHRQCEPLIDPAGQFVFAYLPVRQISQLPFVIQADFSLPASRQDISDNPWNRKLLDGIASLFAECAQMFAAETENVLRYQWLRYLPGPHMTGFWNGFSTKIGASLAHRKAFVSVDGKLARANLTRLLPGEFIHQKDPIVPNNSSTYSYLSLGYSVTDHTVLQNLGVKQLSDLEMVDLIVRNSYQGLSAFQVQPIGSDWHISFAKLIKYILRGQASIARTTLLTRLQSAKIFPFRKPEGGLMPYGWESIAGRSFYLPVLVEEGTGPDKVRIIAPGDLNMSVIHPDAIENMLRRDVYEMLGAKTLSKDLIVSAVLDAQGSGGEKTAANLLSHFELLFWFGHSTWRFTTLKALTMTNEYSAAKHLFFMSDSKHHAEQLVRPNVNSHYKRYFISAIYQSSQVAGRIRDGRSWIEWLNTVAGIRWYPPLNDPQNHDCLHPLIIAIGKENGAEFLPLLQEHWAHDYSKALSNPAIREAILHTPVRCRGPDSVKLKDTWFPSIEVVATAREYDVEDSLSIIKLPNDQQGCEVAAWPSLLWLKIPTSCNLDFYMFILKVLASNERHRQPRLKQMTKLYAKLGSMATFQQKNLISDRFDDKVIWDPVPSVWRSSSQCVWSSQIPLVSMFVITSAYPDHAVKDLFKNFLAIKSATTSVLVKELEEMKKSQSTWPSAELTSKAAQIYQVLSDMATTEELRTSLRSEFKTNSLIYSKGSWHTSDMCVWHESAVVGNHIPIKADFTKHEAFFVNILGVNMFTDTFMMQQMANAAKNPEKDWDNMKQLMLDTSALLGHIYDEEKFKSSLKILNKFQFLPCRMPGGATKYLSTRDTYFLLDDERYSKAFHDRLPVLDFTYLQLNTLQNLFRILKMDDHYLSQHVVLETEEGTAVQHNNLTRRFRECAYAISCCAVFHCSDLYANQATDMHKLLERMVVCTSSDMRTIFSVKINDGNDVVSVTADKARLQMREESEILRVIVPQAKVDRIKCLRADVPRAFATLVKVWKAEAIQQISRFINELDIGTDELLEEEGIPHATAWLSKTKRISLPILSDDDDDDDDDDDRELMMASERWAQQHDPLHNEERNMSMIVGRVETSTFFKTPRISYVSNGSRGANIRMPSQVPHEAEAPLFGQLLQYVRGQAVGVKWRDSLQERTLTTTSGISQTLQNMRRQQGHSDDSRHYPQIFGSDDYVNFRIGAAGEFFVYCLLGSILGERFRLTDWPSSIRHFVRAHPDFQNLSQMTAREIADITYTETNDLDLVKTLQRKVIGDSFPDWLPESLQSLVEQADAGSETCSKCGKSIHSTIEWLFEVKTTLGPCDTAFFMSESQYSKMRKLGTRNCCGQQQIYCIIRVYDLIQETIGIRIFIDPWRFKDSKLEFTGEKWRVKAT